MTVDALTRKIFEPIVPNGEQPGPQKPVGGVEPGPFDGAVQNPELMAKHQISSCRAARLRNVAIRDAYSEENREPKGKKFTQAIDSGQLWRFDDTQAFFTVGRFSLR
jgi:hypothetical protein